jgi:uncharacterized RDD family membrane protein YckC
MSMPPPPAGFGAPAAPMAVPFASWGQRVAATLIDAVILIPIYILAAIFAAIGGIGNLIAFLLYIVCIVLAIYWLIQTGAKGQSPGKKVMGIQVVNANTGQFIGGGMGFVRYLAHIIDGIPCYIGYLFPLWDKKKQTLADKVMSTVVVAGPKMDFMSAIKTSLPGK